MRTNFDFSEATELMKALDHYKKLCKFAIINLEIDRVCIQKN
jgi:hypothetical protein